jgi:hypothetical protein
MIDASAELSASEASSADEASRTSSALLELHYAFSHWFMSLLCSVIYSDDVLNLYARWYLVCSLLP